MSRAGDRGALQAVERGLGAARLLLLLGGLAYALSGVKQIQPNEAAMVLRFGRLVGSTPAEQVRGAGLLLALPYPVDEVVRVPLKEVRELAVDELWAPAPPAGTPPAFTIDPTREGYCLTGDQYIVQPRVSLKFQVSDPVAYFLGTHGPETVIRDAAMAELNRALGALDVDAALTEGKRKLAVQVREGTQARLDAVGVGAQLLAVELRELVPPRAVLPDFQAVVSAGIERRTRVKEARAYEAEQGPKARMQAYAIRRRAEAEKEARLAEVRAELARFGGVVDQARQDPGLVRTRLFHQTMEAALGRVGRQVLVPPPGPGQEPPGLRLLLPDG